MMQPSESLPHDDHIHVRISCPRTMRDSCIELAKNAPSKVARGAKNRRRGGQVTLRTPQRAAKTRHTAHKGHGRSGVVRAGAAQAGDTKTTKGDGPGVTIYVTRPASHEAHRAKDAEAEADAVEVKDALDESGAAKITD